MMDELETGDIPILHFERWSQMQYRNDGGQDMFELDVECRVVKGQMFTAHPTWRTNPCDRAAPPAREGVIPAIVNHIDNDDFLRGVDTILGKRSRESPDNLAVEHPGPSSRSEHGPLPVPMPFQRVAVAAPFRETAVAKAARTRPGQSHLPRQKVAVVAPGLRMAAMSGCPVPDSLRASRPQPRRTKPARLSRSRATNRDSPRAGPHARWTGSLRGRRTS